MNEWKKGRWSVRAGPGIRPSSKCSGWWVRSLLASPESVDWSPAPLLMSCHFQQSCRFEGHQCLTRSSHCGPRVALSMPASVFCPIFSEVCHTNLHFASWSRLSWMESCSWLGHAPTDLAVSWVHLNENASYSHRLPTQHPWMGADFGESCLTVGQQQSFSSTKISEEMGWGPSRSHVALPPATGCLSPISWEPPDSFPRPWLLT